MSDTNFEIWLRSQNLRIKKKPRLAPKPPCSECGGKKVNKVQNSSGSLVIYHKCRCVNEV